MRRWVRLLGKSLPAWAVAAVGVVLVAVVLSGLRAIGFLEPLELDAYDMLLRTRAMTAAGAGTDPRILVVRITEQDIQDQGTWPLPDGVIAQAIAALSAAGARAIGLDVYRDVPVPPGTAELTAVLSRERRVVAVTKFAEGSSAGVAAPAALRGTDRVGFNDIVVDRGGIVRRGLLFLDDGETALYAFALRLALLHLEPDGIGLAPDQRDETLVRLGRTTIRPLASREGPYAALDARGYQFFVDFRGGEPPFERVSLGAVLAGEVSADRIRDRVVLIGVTSDSVKDDFYTPLSGGLGVTQHVPGVEVHAQIVGQLLRIARDGERPLQGIAAAAVWACILAWAALGALVGGRALPPWRLVLVLLGGLVVIVAAGYVGLSARWWLPVVPPALAWLGTTGLVVAYFSHRETIERRVLMNLFSRHVSREVAEAIWQHREHFVDGARPRPQRLMITGLFTDLAGFTTVSERLSPEALMDWLNEYMDAMAQEISRHGGVIRQYAGDSIVAVFGVPVPRQTEEEITRDAVSAVRCAVGLERRLLELNRRWAASGRPVTGMRVGVFTGPAVAGTLGSSERSDYVVVGDTMNTASRLETFDKELYVPDPLTHPCRILIGEPTLARVRDHFETEWVTEARLKGKSQMVAVHRVLRERDPAHVSVAVEHPVPGGVSAPTEDAARTL